MNKLTIVLYIIIILLLIALIVMIVLYINYDCEIKNIVIEDDVEEELITKDSFLDVMMNNSSVYDYILTNIPELSEFLLKEGNTYTKYIQDKDNKDKIYSLINTYISKSLDSNNGLDNYVSQNGLKMDSVITSDITSSNEANDALHQELLNYISDNSKRIDDLIQKNNSEHQIYTNTLLDLTINRS